MNGQTTKNGIKKMLFIIYLIALYEIIVFKLDVPFTNIGYLRNINLMPYNQPLITNGRINFSEIIMNCIIFIPLGIYLEMLYPRKSVIKKILTIAGISLSCEILQYIMAIGASDITDIINNTLGGVIGLFLMHIVLRMFNYSDRVYKVVTTLAAIGTIFMLLLISALVIANL